MTSIGIDTHKGTLAACAIDLVGAVLAERTVGNDPAGHRELAHWIRALDPGARIGIEGSGSYGAAVARFLLGDGLAVWEVPPQLSRRERPLTRRAGKSDPGDALAIARVTARERDLPPVRLPDRTRELGLLLEAREDAVAEATRIRNRLHADLVVLCPGYEATVPNLRRSGAWATIGRRLRRLPGVQAELARARLAELRRLGRVIAALERRLAALVAGHPLLRLRGVAGLTAARLIAETGDIRRFRSPDAFAMFAGVAPVPASSGQLQRVRLNRGGNRQLNRAFWTIAFVQGHAHPPAIAYLARQRAAGHTYREALRALKRRLVRTVFRLLRDGAPLLAGARN